MNYHYRYSFFFFFFNDTATTEIYTLSLHDALPILHHQHAVVGCFGDGEMELARGARKRDRKSTRLNSSHVSISYAVFCLKKKKYKLIFTPNTLRNDYTDHQLQNLHLNGYCFLQHHS